MLQQNEEEEDIAWQNEDECMGQKEDEKHKTQKHWLVEGRKEMIGTKEERFEDVGDKEKEEGED